MRQSKTYIPTQREVSGEIESIAHQLLLKSGYIRQTASGLYAYLPLSNLVMKKIESIVRKEMMALDALEIALPIMQREQLWEGSTRFESFQSELFQFKDRKGTSFVLAPTHEEALLDLVKDELQSYKQLPKLFFQIQEKFRDEWRPRNGLFRSKQFLMKDAYSLHATEESLQTTYKAIQKAYRTIFDALQIKYVFAKSAHPFEWSAFTHKFIAETATGEEKIAVSDESTYAATLEVAAVRESVQESSEDIADIEKFATPDATSIEELVEQHDLPIEKTIKTLVFLADEKVVVFLCRGDHEINEWKAQQFLQAKDLIIADEWTIQEHLNTTIGSIGPVKLPIDIPVYADFAVRSIVNAVTGANEQGFHFKNVNPGRDYAVDEYGDFRYIQEGEPSPDQIGTIHFKKGIELAHLFPYGPAFAEGLQARFLNAEGKTEPFYMGSYGLGLSRILAAIVEQHHDEFGIVWPTTLAPFQIHLVLMNTKDEAQRQLGEELYTLLQSYRYTILYDDREERAGVKFKDADLIGLPVRIVVGKRAEEGIVELKYRKSGTREEWPKEELINQLQVFFEQ